RSDAARARTARPGWRMVRAVPRTTGARALQVEVAPQDPASHRAAARRGHGRVPRLAGRPADVSTHLRRYRSLERPLSEPVHSWGPLQPRDRAPRSRRARTASPVAGLASASRGGAGRVTPSEILDYYNAGQEEHRLASALGRLERIRTWEILERFLPAAPA